ncbi:MAG: hypothetical protein JWR26_1797 [Pedosphaera sp.]|nr:hypothetical protein [Pedosphaera sp.]
MSISTKMVARRAVCLRKDAAITSYAVFIKFSLLITPPLEMLKYCVYNLFDATDKSKKKRGSSTKCPTISKTRFTLKRLWLEELEAFAFASAQRKILKRVE